MMSRRYGLAVLLLAGGVAIAANIQRSPSNQDKSTQLTPPLVPAALVAAQPAKAESVEAGIAAITTEYVKAFNMADAKAAAALWTAEGEYIGADGEVQSGRAAIEKSLAEVFHAHPKATAEIRLESVRLLGRGTASVEGIVRVKVPTDEQITESRYTALHVLEDGKWHAASVREWVPNPATDITTKQLEWIIGEWSARGENGEVKLTYQWDENKVFIRGFYEITKDGKRLSSGTQVIGRNAVGGLKSWMFDSSGTTSESIWVRDGSRWMSEAAGMLTDGTEMTSLNIIVPLSVDSFTWQTTDRAADGVPLPALPPIKVTRVKK